jgi:hypothetical protein
LSVGHVTLENAEQIRQYVLDCSIRRLTSQETAEYLRQKGYPVDVRTVKRYRARIRQSAQSWIANLAKSKRGDYLAQYHERILEIYGLQKKLWEVINDENIGPHNRIEAAAKVLDCSKQLVALFDCLPLVNAIRDYGCGYDHDNNKDLPLYPSSSSPLSHIPSRPCLTRRRLYHDNDSDNADNDDKSKDKDNNSDFSNSDNDSDSDSDSYSNNDGIVT